MIHDGLVYEIAFAHYRNITLDTARHFADKGIGPADFFTKSAGTLAACTGIKSSFFDDARRKAALESALAEKRFIDSSTVIPCFYTDPLYPARLAECNDAPAMLYMAGTAAAAAAMYSVAIVGTRHCTAYGADFTKRLVSDMAEAFGSVLVVSGLAYGIDICAHRAAMDAGLPTAAVLAHGLNTVYPAEHRQDARRIASSGGFVASEYRSSDSIHRGNFLARNRIVAGLADVTIVVESDIKGGAMATARIAGEYNRDVMALPGRINDAYSRGCNHLIATRAASVIRGVDDLVEITGWQPRPKAGEQQQLRFEMPAAYAAVLEALKECPDATVNDLCVRLSLPYASLSSTLFQMEMDDYIIALPGGRYTLPARQ